MVQQDVAACGWPQRCPRSTLTSRSCGGTDGHEGRIPQVRPVQPGNRPQAAHTQRRLQRVDVVGQHLQVLHQQLHHRLGHLVVDRQPHHRAELAQPQPLLDGLEQVGRLVLLDFHVGIADHLEAVVLEHVVAREQQAEVGGDDLLEPDPAMLGTTGTSRGSDVGTLMRAKRSSPDGPRTSTARLRLRFEMWGKGRPGSNASGVTTGSTSSMK